MSGETEEQVSGWTVDTLNSHIWLMVNERDRRYEQRFQAQEQAVTAALAAAEKAVVKAEAAAEKRFESVNEFRQTLTDQATLFIPRSEAEQRMIRTTEDLATLASRFNAAEGRRAEEDRKDQNFGIVPVAIASAIASIAAVAAVIISLVR